MSQSDKKDNVVIVGAGVSGLVCAIELEKRGFAPLIIDALPKVGGRLQTVLMEDFPLDKGFQVLLSEYPAVKKYLDLEALNLRSFRPGAIVFKGDKQYPMGDPLRDSAFLWDTIRFPFGSIKDKFKVWQLNKQLRGKSIEDIFDSASTSTMSYLKEKGFSDQMITAFFKPFFGGIFLEGDLLTSSRMFEFVFKMFAEGKATLPKRGIQEVAFQLKSKLKKSRFMMNTKVLNYANGMLQLDNGNSLAYDKLFLASSTHSMKDGKSSQAWQSCINVYFECADLAFDQDIIALSANSGLVNNFSMIKGSGNGHIMSLTLLESFEGSDDELIDALKAEFTTVYGIELGDCLQINRIAQALPVVDELRSEVALSAQQLGEGVYTCGDYMANASLNAAMLSGANAVRLACGA